MVGEGPGIELTTAAINALGRLLEKGVSEEASRLLMAQFRRERSGPEKAVRELRRACVTALGGGSESAEVRDRLRAFHEEILASMEKDLRIPAILGLGTLARQRDAGALDALMKVIVLHERFESQEVAAAADSIAYVGGQAALSAFADCLLETKDKGLEEHIWKKIVSAIETGKGPVFAWTLESLEERALREDSSQPLEHAVRLESEPPLVALLAPERLDLGNGDRLEPLWRAHLALARSKDALGDEAGAAAALARLAELLQKAPEAKEKASGAGRALATLKGALAQRAALRARLAKPEAGDPAPLEKDLDAVLASDPSLTGRWRNLRWLARQMAQGLPAQSAGRVRSLVQKSLGGDERRALWDGFPAGFRERYLGRLEAAGAERKAPEGQG
ncbi:MAG: hypothetical protein HY721_06270 [Planctomycetes bacterium]|nr:hypothetical protein [Planctomycetota bacterium]